MLGAMLAAAVLAMVAGWALLGDFGIDNGDAGVEIAIIDTSPGEARADGGTINNRDSNIRTCIAAFGFYSLTGFGLACAPVFDLTHQFGEPITNGVNYHVYGGYQMWLNILHNMGLQSW
jgi:hypothetical protein